MKPQDFLVAIIYSIAIFGTIKVFIAWLQGRINSPVAWEWFLRGFFMAWGFTACFFVVLFIVKISTDYLHEILGSATHLQL